MSVKTLHATSLRLDGNYMYCTVSSALFTAAVETLHATSLRLDGNYTYCTVSSALFTAAVEQRLYVWMVIIRIVLFHQHYSRLL